MPPEMLYPLVMAILAAIVASQALMTGKFPAAVVCDVQLVLSAHPDDLHVRQVLRSGVGSDGELVPTDESVVGKEVFTGTLLLFPCLETKQCPSHGWVQFGSSHQSALHDFPAILSPS